MLFIKPSTTQKSQTFKLLSIYPISHNILIGDVGVLAITVSRRWSCSGFRVPGAAASGTLPGVASSNVHLDLVTDLPLLISSLQDQYVSKAYCVLTQTEDEYLKRKTKGTFP
jgi:hypothetical protein